MQCGFTILSGSGSFPLQVPHDFCALHALILDSSLDVLGGHDRQGHRGREGGQAQGDSEDHGPEERNLLAELGSVLHNAAGHQLCPRLRRPEGDSTMIQGGPGDNFGGTQMGCLF